MKPLSKIVMVSLFPLFLSGCGSSTPGVDVSNVLKRTSDVLTAFQNKMKADGVTKLEKTHMTQLSGHMANAMNTAPAISTSPVGVQVLKDSSFEGFADANKNNIKDSGEKKLFKVEIDFDNNRLIGSGVSERSGFTGMGLATGMMAGMLMGRLMGGQRSAGVRSGAFSGRKVQSRSAYSQKRAAARSNSARSKARSGGRFGGK